MQLTLRQLHYFVAIVDAANMSRAAARLHVAPTALSLQVRAMEDALGVRLLDRHSRGVRPTERGRTLHARAREILALVDEAERALRPEPAGAERVLRLGMPPAAARVVGVEAVLGTAEGFEGLSLQVSEGLTADHMDRLGAGELDFVLGYAVREAEGIEAIQLLEEDLVLVGTPARVGAAPRVALAEALGMELIFYGERSISAVATDAAAAAAGIWPVQKQDVEAIDIWRSMLCRGVAAAIAPFGAVAEECRRGELVARAVHQPRLTQRLGLAGRTEAFAFARPIGFIDFLADLIVRAHVAHGPYYRALERTPAR